ncbi:MAG TPA: zinc-dependent metalloprotease [Thermoleophilaceae bacterium]|nr:zinc-dependent metalloprotease [Thermoleophilaceae bacterium]
MEWSLARQIARFAAGGDGGERVAFDFADAASTAVEQVSAYSGLALAGAPPPVHEVGRAEWAAVNLDSLADLLDPVSQRLDERLGGAGPLAGPLRAAAGATLAAEVGLVMGYMSQRVLGQYELSLLQPEVPPRLLFVTPNLARAVNDLEVDEESFLRWVVLHEVTHVLQFSGVTWLREHLGALLREYLATVEVRIDRGAAGGLPSLPDPSRIVERFREGGLAALVQTREQRRIMERIQCAMAIVEGYSEHVMDAVGSDVLPHYEGLRDAMERRRSSRSAPERALMRLLGLDQKMRQYEDGKRFCDAVVAEGGIERLNFVWHAPTALPTAGELRSPATWIGRLEADPVVAL